jgi:hypothetical protein
MEITLGCEICCYEDTGGVIRKGVEVEEKERRRREREEKEGERRGGRGRREERTMRIGRLKEDTKRR